MKRKRISVRKLWLVIGCLAGMVAVLVLLPVYRADRHVTRPDRMAAKDLSSEQLEPEQLTELSSPSPGYEELLRPAEEPASSENKAGTPAPQATDRYHDGKSWHEAFWAPDEALLVLEAGADLEALPEELKVLEHRSEWVLVSVAPGDRDEFAASASELEAHPSVREVRPVFYSSARGLEERSSRERMNLTRQLAVEVPEELDPHQLAARYSARVVSELSYRPGTYLMEVSSAFEALRMAEALHENEELAMAAPQFAIPHYPRWIPNDPKFSQQWHLRNTGQSGGTSGVDIKAAGAWDTTKGSGIVVGIIDDGIQWNHPELQPNYNASLSIDITGGDSDPSPESGDDHGTCVAGCAAARGNNGLGVAGSAPYATIAGIRLGGGASDAEDAQSMTHQNQAIHVKNCSWGPADGYATLEHVRPLTEAAIINGVTQGRGGRGVVYVWAGGNGQQGGDDVNYDGYANMRQTIAVSAVDHNGRQGWYSDPGAGANFARLDWVSAGYAHLTWRRVDWAAYNSADGETRPACGDLDGDGAAELVVGLAPFQTAGGWMYTIDDAVSGYDGLRWIRLDWSSYNSQNGETWPAVGNLR